MDIWRSVGPMDKASAYGAEDSRFDPWTDRFSQGLAILLPITFLGIDGSGQFRFTPKRFTG
jgi:hypothetical protein